MARPLARLAVVAAAAVIGACNQSSLPNFNGRVPQFHRAQAASCPTTRATANDCMGQSVAPPDGGPGNVCALDGDCSGGHNGRCIATRFGCQCSYDTCFGDAECGGGQTCDCRDTTYLKGGRPNQCVSSNCRVDTDCAGGKGYCSPTLDPSCGTYIGVTGWYCHTSADTCLDDSDCTQAPTGSGVTAGYCAYQPEVGHWACSYSFCVG